MSAKLGWPLLSSLSLLLVFCPGAHAARQDEQRRIERDVWIPLLAASDAFDAEGFLSVQSKDLVRVAVDAKRAYGLARYRAEIREGFERARGRGVVRRSEVRFLERAASEGLAYETGYFREEAALPGGGTRIRYSRFEFVMRREAGKWRILVDRDTAAGGAITEEELRAATPLRRPEAKE